MSSDKEFRERIEALEKEFAEAGGNPLLDRAYTMAMREVAQRLHEALNDIPRERVAPSPPW